MQRVTALLKHEMNVVGEGDDIYRKLWRSSVRKEFTGLAIGLIKKLAKDYKNLEFFKTIQQEVKSADETVYWLIEETLVNQGICMAEEYAKHWASKVGMR